MMMRLPKMTKAAESKFWAKYPTTAARKKYRAEREKRRYELMLRREAIAAKPAELALAA